MNNNLEENTGIDAALEREEMRAWMSRVEEANAQQVKYAKEQCVMARISAVCSGGMLVIVIVCVLILLPKLLGTFKQMNTVFSEVDAVIAEMDTVMKNLDATSAALAETDMKGMLDGVNRLVEDSQKGIEEAMNKITAIDIDTMNGAIKDFKTIVEPLAKLFGRK